MEEKEIGYITHFFGHISVAAIKITSDSLSVGDTIKVKGHTSDFEQKIDSIQINKAEVKEAKKGDEIGIKIKDRVRPNDKVFKILK